MLLRTLPDAVPSARHEIAESYVSRLATLHGLGTHALWIAVTRSEPPVPPAVFPSLNDSPR